MNKRLTPTVIVLILCIPLLLSGCWRRKKAVTFGIGEHELAMSKTEGVNTSRYDIDAK